MTAQVLHYADVLASVGSPGQPFIANAVHIEQTEWVVRRRDYVEIFAVTAGAGLVQIHARSGGVVDREIGAGHVHLYRPTEDTVLHVTDPRGLDAVAVVIPRAEWEAFAKYLALDATWMRSDEPPTAILDPHDLTWRVPFDLVVRDYHTTSSQLDLLRFLVEVIRFFVPTAALRTRGRDAPRWLRDGLEAMHEERNLVAGLHRFVELSHVTPQHLAKAVRRFFGTTPGRLINEIRMRHAATLLVSTSLHVAEIARRCGFSTAAHFSNRFREYYRMSPRSFRQRHHELAPLG